MGLTRRQFGKLGVSAFLLGPVLASAPGLSLAANPTGVKRIGLSAFGDLALAESADAFSYVNADAPKGGTFNFAVPNWAYNQNPQTFDTLNTLTLKGTAPPRLELIYDTLMVRDFSDPSAIYGRLAKNVEISEDRNSYTFELRPEARFHDGSPLTADDIAFTYALLKEQGHPQIQVLLADLVEARAEGKETVALVFNGEQSDRVVLTALLLPIISKAFYSENDFASSTMEVPLGSGPYRVGRLSADTFIEYDRVADYWGKDLYFAKGQFNFETLRIEFFRERQAGFEAFKKGDVHFRQEFTSKTWATEYDFPAVNEGRVKRVQFDAGKRPIMQAWACNMRRKKLADPRTREAIGLCFDFEWTNESLFFNAYSRAASYFENSDYAARGAPSDAEIALLEPFRDQLELTVFGEPFVPPVSDGSGRDRSLLRKASQLLQAAGWRYEGRQLVDAGGQPFTLEFLIRSPTFKRILGQFVANLKAIGIAADVRLVDPPQFQRRLDTYDFDILGRALSYQAVPSAEGLSRLFGSESAAVDGSGNLPGLRSPVVDALLETIAGAENLDDMTIAMRALDRVLRITHAWIPNWISQYDNVAHWDMFGYVEQKPDYGFPVEQLWWYDSTRARAIGKDS